MSRVSCVSYGLLTLDTLRGWKLKKTAQIRLTLVSCGKQCLLAYSADAVCCVILELPPVQSLMCTEPFRSQLVFRPSRPLRRGRIGNRTVWPMLACVKHSSNRHNNESKDCVACQTNTRKSNSLRHGLEINRNAQLTSLTAWPVLI